MGIVEDAYRDQITKLLKENGELGVNAIAEALDKPVSNIQRYLERQNYFVKTQRRKWYFADGMSVSGTTVLKGEVKQIVESQVKTINTTYELLRSQLSTMVAFINNHRFISDTIAIETVPVADSGVVDERLIKLQEETDQLTDIFKNQKGNIPAQYKELFDNYDHVAFVLKRGTDVVSAFMEDEIFSLLSGRITELSYETVSTLKEYQK